MKLRKRFVIPSIFLIASLLLSACSLTGTAAVPTIDPVSMQATIDAAVAQALQAAAMNQTSTAAALPTNTFTVEPTLEPTATATLTPEPTFTSTPQPTATVQYIVVTNTPIPATYTPSATPTPAYYSCQVVNISPSTGTKMNINNDYDAVWKVKNIGTKAWESGYVDLVYVSGTKMQTKADIFDVNTSVVPGAEITLTVDMLAPASAGKYAATFALKMEGITMCTLPVNIEAVVP